MIPESKADTGEGAMGCASGNQKWRGKAPAFIKHPRINKKEALLFKLHISKLPFWMYTDPNEIKIRAPPIKHMIKYINPALLAFPAPLYITKKNENNVVISKNI